MNWTIIEYKPEHTDQLRMVYRQARQLAFPWADPLSFQLLDFDQVIQGETVLVATHRMVPVGFIAWWPLDNFIHSLFIDPLFTGKGIGKALLQACLLKVGRPVTLKCKVANEKALRFYLSQGWSIIAEAQDLNGPYFLLAFYTMKEPVKY